MNVLLLDAYNLLYRSFTSLPRTITGSDSRPIHGVYGMLNTVLRLWRELGPDSIVAAFDTPEVPTFRSQLYAGYQAQRGPLGGEHADEFSRQARLARDVLPKLGIPVPAMEGYEADDIIGTLSTRVAQAGGQATIVSTDRDLTQLVAAGIAIILPGKEPRWISSDDDVRSLLGVSAADVTTFKALAGDPSDNIPGVRGIGRKGAADLVTRYHSLDAIYADLDNQSPRTATALRAGREDAYLFQTIVTIHTDLNLDLVTTELPAPQFSDSSRAREIIEQHLTRYGTPGGIRTPGL